MTIIPDMNAQIQPVVGGLETLMDHIQCQAGPNQVVQAEYIMPQPLHMHGTFASWQGMEYGDRAFMNVQPVGLDCSPIDPLNPGDATVELPPGLGVAYQGAGIKILEFWSSDDTVLLEQREIQSIDEDVVTLKTGVTHTIPIDAIIRPVIQSYSPVRGPDGISAGVSFLGEGKINIDNINQISDVIPEGLRLALRVFTVAGGGTRRIVLNFKFRVPAAE